MRRALLAAIIIIPTAYVLSLLFIVPPTEEARAVASVLFAWVGILTGLFGFVVWKLR